MYPLHLPDIQKQLLGSGIDAEFVVKYWEISVDLSGDYNI
jgi:hypothetical protein